MNVIKESAKQILKYTSRIKPQILFESFNGAQYSDNPRAISELMHKIYPQYKIVWYLNENANTELVPDYIECVSSRTGYFKALFSSFCFVNNCEFHGLAGLKKDKQLYIQTWHGDRYFKKILYEADSDWAIKSRMCDSDVVDIALSGSRFGMDSYSTAFRYHNRIDCYGCPRNEKMLLMSETQKTDIKKKLKIEKDEKVFLYAPTFRDTKMNTQNVFINIESTRHAIESKYGGKWVAVVRGHVGKKLSGFDRNSHFIDATKYPDMADILAITDFLITDYSSTATDFYLTGRPVILATFDILDYEKNCRGFKINPLKSGFICASSQEELEIIIISLDDEEIRKSYRIVDETYGTEETGFSTEKICKVINQFYISNF